MGGVGTPPEQAAYGLRLAGAAPPTPWLAVHGAARASWPLLHVERALRLGAAPRFDASSLRLAVAGPSDPAELVHPLLGRIAAIAAAERGGDALHAGAVGDADGAWALIGPKRAGKSTLLAACAAARLGVVTDDVLVLDRRGTESRRPRGAWCLTGPRCLDLRLDVGDRFGSTVPVRPDDPRARLTLPPAAAERPLRGIVHLSWDRHCSFAPLSPGDALARLIAVRARDGWPRGAETLLDLAALPTFELRRPPGWEVLDELVGLLTAALGLTIRSDDDPARSRSVSDRRRPGRPREASPDPPQLAAELRNAP